MSIEAQVYPNPFTSGISVEVKSDEEKQVIFRLYNNQNGHLIKMNYWRLVKGNNKIILGNLQYLKDGAYSIELKNDKEDLLYSNTLIKK